MGNPLSRWIRPALACLAAASALWPLAITPAAAADPPSTGFESSIGERWTTASEESQFLAAVDRGSHRIAIAQIGTTVQGRPLRLVQLGAPAEQGKPVLLLVCTQHGDEPSAREACLATIRDLAYAQDTATRRLLERTTVMVIPTANPDGRAMDARNNAEGIDINRDHLALKTAEARAIATVIREHRPAIVYDLHEFNASEPYYAKDILALWPRNLGTDAGIHREAKALSEDYVRPAAEDAGYDTGVYGFRTDPATGARLKQIAGDGDERILRNTVGLKHGAGLLLEVRSTPLSKPEREDPAANNRRRVDSQRAALGGALTFLAEHRDALQAATTAARRTDDGPLHFDGADNDPPAQDQIIANPPCGYRLDAAQYAGVRARLNLHGITVREQGAKGAFVPLRQPLRALAALLLDERATYRLTAATPVKDC